VLLKIKPSTRILLKIYPKKIDATLIKTKNVAKTAIQYLNQEISSTNICGIIRPAIISGVLLKSKLNR
jgi:hypothetical protein